MDNNIDNIDDLFREGFADYAETPPPAVWQALERRLDNDKKRRVFPIRWFWYIGILIVAMVLGASIGMQYMSESGKETLQLVTAEGNINVLPLAGETVTGEEKNTTEESAAHTMPAQKEDANRQYNVTSESAPEVEKGNETGHIQKNSSKEPKATTERIAEKQQATVKDEKNTTSENAATTGTSMYSYDDFEHMETDENETEERKGKELEEAGYVVSKKKKNRIVVVEQVPEAIAIEERKNAYASESTSTAKNMKGKGVQIAKASAGNVVDETKGKLNDEIVAATAKEPTTLEDTETKELNNDGTLTGNENKKEKAFVSNSATSAIDRKIKRIKTDQKKVAVNQIRKHGAAKQNRPSYKKAKGVLASKLSENQDNAVKQKATAMVVRKTINNSVLPPSQNDSEAKNGKGQGRVALKSEATAIANKTSAKKTSRATNTTVSASAAKTVQTSTAVEVPVPDKQKAERQNATAARKMEQVRVSAKSTVNTETIVEAKNKKEDTPQNVQEQKVLNRRETAVVQNVAIAKTAGKKAVKVNVGMPAAAIANKKSTGKKEAQAGIVDTEPKKVVQAASDNNKQDNKATGIAKDKKLTIPAPNIGKERGNKTVKKQASTLAGKVNGTRLKAQNRLVNEAAVAHSAKAKQAGPSKQKALMTGDVSAAETETENALGAAVAAKGGKQEEILASKTAVQAGAKWVLSSKMPEEENASDYIVGNDMKPAISTTAILAAAAKNDSAIMSDSTIRVAATSAIDSVKSDTTTHSRRFVLGVKAGVETGMAVGGANKAVVSPYLQYKFSDRLSLMVQPALKMAGLSTRNVGSATTYYDVNPGTGSYKITDSALLILVLTGDTLWNRNYEYTERYDSVVKTNKTGVNYMEIELPLLLQYKLTKRLSVYGGVNTVYGKKMGVTEHTYTAKAMPKTGYVNTLAQFYAPAPAPTGTGITYTGNPLSGYTGPQYPSETGGMFRFGYMFGVSYELRKRWLADVLVQQCIVQQNLVVGYNVNRPLSVPYIRLTLGYRLSK